jgi:hypothetical protein
VTWLKPRFRRPGAARPEFEGAQSAVSIRRPSAMDFTGDDDDRYSEVAGSELVCLELVYSESGGVCRNSASGIWERA